MTKRKATSPDNQGAAPEEVEPDSSALLTVELPEPKKKKFLKAPEPSPAKPPVSSKAKASKPTPSPPQKQMGLVDILFKPKAKTATAKA